jgi:hypothetical protein
MPMVTLLVERGADRSVKEDLYHATPEGGAQYFGQVEVRDYLRSHEVKGGGSTRNALAEAVKVQKRTDGGVDPDLMRPSP